MLRLESMELDSYRSNLPVGLSNCWVSFPYIYWSYTQFIFNKFSLVFFILCASFARCRTLLIKQLGHQEARSYAIFWTTWFLQPRGHKRQSQTATRNWNQQTEQNQSSLLATQGLYVEKVIRMKPSVVPSLPTLREHLYLDITILIQLRSEYGIRCCMVNYLISQLYWPNIWWYNVSCVQLWTVASVTYTCPCTITTLTNTLEIIRMSWSYLTTQQLTVSILITISILVHIKVQICWNHSSHRSIYPTVGAFSSSLTRGGN